MNKTTDLSRQVDQLYPLIKAEELLTLTKLFRNDLTAALSNQQSSLPAILNPVAKMRPHPGLGIAVAIGGTNGYASLFRIKKSGDIKFLNRHLFSLPLKTTQKDLFHQITRNILLTTNGKKDPLPIGIGLAYPLKPILHSHKFIDGQLLYMTKGRSITGLIGKMVGQEYHKFLKKEYQIDTTITVANDAICLLLGGDKVDIAGVVGTGLNFAYWDKRSAIAPLKLNELAGFAQNEVAVNIESKNFDKIKGNKFRDLIDKNSDDPGFSLAEKEAAGAYLFEIFNRVKKVLLQENFPELSSTDELNDILTNAFPFPKSIDDQSRQLAKLLAEQIFHRSSQVVAIELCGILLKIGKTEGIAPVVMEGGIFWKAQNYPSLVNLYINMIFPKCIPSYARLFGSSRRGIAILARNGLL